MVKTIYTYSRQSGEYLCPAFADESPLEPGVFLIPSCATETPPPESKSNEVACFGNGSWSLKPDFRGKYWDTVSKEMHEIIDIDVEPDPRWTNKEPGSAQIWNGNNWILDIEAAKESILAIVQAEKSRVKDGGFLLDGILFDSDDAAQIAYLQLQVKLGMNPAYTTQWKASKGVWVTMDATLFAKIVTAIEAHSASCFAWQAAKELEIAACTTEAEIEAVSLVFGE